MDDQRGVALRKIKQFGGFSEHLVCRFIAENPTKNENFKNLLFFGTMILYGRGACLTPFPSFKFCYMNKFARILFTRFLESVRICLLGQNP